MVRKGKIFASILFEPETLLADLIENLILLKQNYRGSQSHSIVGMVRL